MRKFKFMIIPLIIIIFITSYAYYEKEKYNRLDNDKTQLVSKVKELEDKNRELNIVNKDLKKAKEDLELGVSLIQNFEMPKDFTLVRSFHFSSDETRSRYYEYKTNLDNESLLTFLRDQVKISGKRIGRLSTTLGRSKITEDNSILYFVQYGSGGIERNLIVYTHTYLNEKHILFYESNRTEDNPNVTGGPGCMLLYIPMTDGTVKEVLLNEYHYAESCKYNIANSIMKEYHEQLNKIENSINVNIKGEDALNIPVSPIVSNTVWKVQLSEDRLPTKENERELYLSNLALSILAGHKYRAGDITFKKVMFINENGEKIKEYKLEDFKGRF